MGRERRALGLDPIAAFLGRGSFATLHIAYAPGWWAARECDGQYGSSA